MPGVDPIAYAGRRRWQDTGDPDDDESTAHGSSRISVGDEWLNTATGALWVCTDDEAATWMQIAPGYKRMSANQAVSSTTPVGLTALDLTLLEGTTYEIEWFLFYTVSSTSTGLGLELTWPVGGSDAQNNALIIAPNTTLTNIDGGTWGSGGSTVFCNAGHPNTSKVWVAKVTGLFRQGDSGGGGDLEIAVARANTGTLTVQVDSCVKYRAIGPNA